MLLVIQKTETSDLRLTALTTIILNTFKYRFRERERERERKLNLFGTWVGVLEVRALQKKITKKIQYLKELIIGMLSEYSLPYILESNPQPFYSFRGL